MKRSSLLLFVSLLAGSAHPNATAQPHLWHRVDGFQSLDGWSGDTAAWIVQDGVVRIDTRAYDQVLTSPWWIETAEPWTLEIDLRGRRAGVYFALDDRGSKALSHMVRFEDRTILVGRFNGGGEFTATSTFEAPVDAGTWLKLRLDVEPTHNRVKVFVNDAMAGIDSQLVFPSGWVGLQASEGLAEFRSIAVRGAAGPAPTRTVQKGDRLRLAHVAFVESHGPSLCVFEATRKVWMTLRNDGTVHRTHGGRQAPAPVTMAIVGTRQYSIEGSRIMVTRPRGARPVDSLTSHVGGPYSIALTPRAMLVSDPTVNAVLEFDLQGNYLREHRARSIGGFRAPRGMTVLDDGRVAVADYDRIVLLRPGKDEPTLVIRPQEDGSLRLRRSDNRSLKSVSVLEEDEAKVTIEQDGSARIVVLAPLHTAHVRYSPAVETVPSSFSSSLPVPVTSPPVDRSTMAVRRLRLLYLVYRSIDYREAYPVELHPHVPDGRTLTDEDIVSLRAGVEFNREFFFRNSGCRLSLDFDFVVVDRPLVLSDVGDRDPYWLEPRDRVAHDVDSAATQSGRSPTAYDGIICTYAWQNHPPRRPGMPAVAMPGDTVRIRQAYGGGTYGVPAPWKYGSTSGYTGNPFQDRFSRQDWLITHEFHHQLDALMEASGLPEYDHADQPWKMPGRFGEDFDFNAKILRRAAEAQWMGLRFGTLVPVRDADRDGIPDGDPSLPMDELRFGSSPNRRDTDGDGLDDLRELMAGTSRGSAPTLADTDEDGTPDGKDPEPMSPVPFTIHRISTSVLHTVVKERLGAVDVVWAMGWAPDSLVVEVRTSAPASVLFQLDADNDGWFHGFDNLQVRIVSEGDSVRLADAYLRDCSSWVHSPRDRKDVFSPGSFLFRSWRHRTADVPALRGDVVRFVVPRAGVHGLSWSSGKKVAIRLAVQTQNDLWVWDEFFERNAMKTFQLR